jgi:N-methylhydantoinase B
MVGDVDPAAGLALVTNRGMADLLLLGRQNRRELYRAQPRLAGVLSVLPALRLEAAGRIDAQGREVEPLDEAELQALAARIAAAGVRAVAVCGLFSHLNPAHEQRIAARLAACVPGLRIAQSHQVLPQPREYERFRATVQHLLGDEPATAPPPPPADEIDALGQSLAATADRMQALLMSQARSSIAREAGDCAAALFLPDGRMLAQARWLPLLLGSLIGAVQAVLRHAPAAAMQPGDGFLLNDPWDGGTHLPDLTLVVPLFDAAGRVQALAACSLHHQDVGGIAPGSVPPDARSIFEEGLRVPPLRSHRDGRLDPVLRALLAANSRTPDHLLADLQAQWNAAALAADELQALWRHGGHEAFARRAQALLARTEALTRQALAAAPDGRWTVRDQLDSDGVDDRPVPLQVTLDKRGDALTIDFDGSAPQTRGPANASPACLLSALLYFVRTLAPDAPDNGGGLAAVTLRLPEGSVVNPRFPAAVNARTATVKLAANALLAAWGQQAAAVSAAAHAGVAVVLSLGGQDESGQAFACTEIIASGAGASALGPGESAVSTDVGNARNTAVEVIEAQAPVRVEACELRRDSGGAGRHRGGDGVRRVYRLLHGQAQLSYRGERHRSQAAGCAGGAPGAGSAARVLRADGRVELLGARARVSLQAGDRWIIETAGGGGWGPADAAGDAGATP